jgi:hypothetical protein
MNLALDSRAGTDLQFSAGIATGERFAAACGTWRRLYLVAASIDLPLDDATLAACCAT